MRRYFRTKQEQIADRQLLGQGYPIGNYFVKSSHNHVIGQRLRRNGRAFRADRLHIIADLPCEYKSNGLAYVFEQILPEPNDTKTA